MTDRREYMREYQRKWIAKRRADFFAGKRCAIWWCGSTVNLELDHVDPKLVISGHGRKSGEMPSLLSAKYCVSLVIWVRQSARCQRLTSMVLL